MEAGRELDKIIAWEIMGWRWIAALRAMGHYEF